MSISINGKDLSPYIGAVNDGKYLDGTCIRQTINAKRPINEDFITFKETYKWNGDVIDITSWIIRDADEARLSNIASHFQVDLSEIREFLEIKRQQKRKPRTKADLIRAMTDEELAHFMARVCPPGGKCNEDGNCFACRRDWLKSPVEVDNADN